MAQPVDPIDAAEDALHVGATRPAMLWGIPLPLGVALILVAGELLLNMPQGMPKMGVAWWVGLTLGTLGGSWGLLRMLLAHDLYGIDVTLRGFCTWAMTARDRAIWGGGSRSPLPARQTRMLGMRHVG